MSHDQITTFDWDRICHYIRRRQHKNANPDRKREI